VFTGGANSVFYLEPQGPTRNGQQSFRNITERAKRKTEAVTVRLEHDLVYEIVRGRDVNKWCVVPGSYLLCPHTAETRMHALSPEYIQGTYPLVWHYLQRMRPVLEARKGFAGWEKQFLDEAFYAIQRVGEYTFAPYKVAWRYIALDFIVAVVGPDVAGRPRLCNDKVMFVPVSSPEEAYYLCGVLSSSPVRWTVISTVKNTQISTSAITGIRVPRFEAGNALHSDISAACRAGHEDVAAGRLQSAQEKLSVVSTLTGRLFGYNDRDLRCFEAELLQRYGSVSFSLSDEEDTASCRNARAAGRRC